MWNFRHFLNLRIIFLKVISTKIYKIWWKFFWYSPKRFPLLTWNFDKISFRFTIFWKTEKRQRNYLAREKLGNLKVMLDSHYLSEKSDSESAPKTSNFGQKWSGKIEESVLETWKTRGKSFPKKLVTLPKNFFEFFS